MDSYTFTVQQKQCFAGSDIAERTPCGRYARCKRILGRGAFKDVYKGFDHVNNREIAWYQICIDDETPKNRESLCSEAVLLKTLNHKNVMKCYSCWIDDPNKTVNMVTELFASGSLRQHMKKLGPASAQTIKNWGRQILRGLKYIHTRRPRIIHRDLKCDNIFVDGEVIKIGDFGLATTMEGAPLQTLAGTPEFMAPEFYDEEYDELVDVYAFGMCLMEMATLECPYSECSNPAQVFKKVSSGIKPLALSKVEDNEVKVIIEKCLLPACLRPSASELLEDPFFLSGAATEIGCMDASSVVVDNTDELVATCTSSLEVAFDSMGSLITTAEDENYYMDDSILSDISALYSEISMSNAVNYDRLHGHSNHSSMGDVSMNSKITFASSSGAVSKDFCSFTSIPPYLSG